MIRVLASLISLVTSLTSMADVQFSRETTFSAVCDASAGAMLNDDLFAAADDESNHLRIYSLSRGGAPLFDIPMSRFLRVDPREPEADIEGAARVGEVIYWITSHARNKDGKLRHSRQRLFASRIVSLDPPRLEPFGRPYEKLLADFEHSSELTKFDLEDAAELAPKEKHALNIEGLCARPDGSLLIGFRNPVPKKKALLVPLLNPAELMSDPKARAQFGPPIRLDLEGRGIRDMVQKDGKFFLLAGAYNGADRFELYQWDGQKALTLLHRWEKHSLNPEAILAFPGNDDLLVLTDEGSKSRLGRPCAELPSGSRRFRGLVMQLPAP